MTQLVRNLSREVLSKNTLFFVLVFTCIFTLFYVQHLNIAFGQGSDGIPGIDRPYRPGERPPVTPTPTPAPGGSPGIDYGTPLTVDEAAAAAAEAEALATSENLGALDDPVLQFLHKYVLTGIGSFVGYTGEAFDYAIEEYIIGFGNLYINKNVGVAIDSLWSTVRDIFNLTFIFGLVYIGFKMILDSGDSNARKMLVSLIGAALLVNFSLFITKFVVDFSNIAAAQIYNAFSGSGAADFSITNGFMTMMGVGQIFSVEMTASAGYAYIVGMLIVFAVLIYVFLAGAVMIIIRFVVLCIYMVFSPMMFLGWVFPSMKGHSEKYWSGFLKQAFFAPAFIFMLYLSYRVTHTFNYTTKNWGHFFGQGVADPVGVDGLIPFFAMVVVFLLASIMVAKNMGAVGASTVVSVGQNIRGRAQVALGGATAGMAARVGRSTVGAGASRLAESKNFKYITSRTGALGKSAMFAAGSVADSSFDARKVGGIGKSLGIGEGKKGGFTTRLKETKESDHKFMEALGTIDKDKDPEIIAAKQAVAGQEAEVAKRQLDLANANSHVQKQAAISMLEKSKADLAVLKTDLESKVSAFGPEKVYANQLAYIKNKESWQNMQHKVLSGVAVGAGAGAALLTGGLLAPAAIAGTAYATSLGSGRHTKADVKALRKEYGADGSAKKKSKDEEENAKRAMAMLGVVKKSELEAAKGQGAHDAGHGKPDHKPAASPKPHTDHKPAAAPAASGGGDHHH